MRDYQTDIKIDYDNLEETWLRHPGLVSYYNDLYADAVEERDKAKALLDVVGAKLDGDIRLNFKKYGFDSKPTEGAIKNTIMLQKKFKKQNLAFIKATKQVNLTIGIKNSFEHRKKALGDLVSLHISGFHASPRNNMQDLKRKRTKAVHNKQKQKLKGGKRKKQIS